MPIRIVACLIVCLIATVVGAEDLRNVETGRVMPALKYADQPYVVVTKTERWVCVLTTGEGHEGSGGQHVASAVSDDRGRTWSKLVAIESPKSPSASWACPLLTKSGRIYAFYTYNGDNVRLGRDDTHGWYAFKYSDDDGRTWSKQRYRLPMRTTACDTIRRKGKVVHHFWGICKPIIVGDTVYFSFTKLGKYFLGDGEGWLFRSDNILTEKDPAKIRWKMLPRGQRGIRNPKFGSVQEEHNLAPLSKPGHLACVYRTTKGFCAIAYTRDSGETWSKPKPMRYSPRGRIIRHPRACPKIWRCGNGKFLLWCHQHGGANYNDRNPVWICGGVEVDGEIRWSQPEILLYHDQPKKRMSYPDLIEIKGRYWVTETEKAVARVHEIDPSLLAGLWSQFDCKTEIKRGLVLDLTDKKISEVGAGGAIMPKLGDLSKRGGFTVDITLRLADLKGPKVVLDSRLDGKGEGITVTKTEDGVLSLAFSDGKRSGAWSVDKGVLKTGRLHHVVFIVDGGPGVVSCVVDGEFCDGTTHRRQFGWGRFDRKIDSVGGGRLRFPDDGEIEIIRLRIYNRYLRTSEAISNFRAATGQKSN